MIAAQRDKRKRWAPGIARRIGRLDVHFRQASTRVDRSSLVRWEKLDDHAAHDQGQRSAGPEDTMTQPDQTDVFAAVLQTPDPAEKLRLLGAIGRERVTQAIAYYEKGTPTKRWWARTLRGTALILATAAGVAPLATSIVVALKNYEIEVLRDLSALSALLAALAVACVAVDKLFGFSAAWMRFLTASLDLQSKRNAFNAQWARACVRAGNSPGRAQVLDCLDMLIAFIATIDETVRNETQSWVAEFRGALTELDKNLDATRAQMSASTLPERGAVEVHVAKVETFEETRWNLQVGDREAVVLVGSASAAVTQLAPGVLKVAVSARRAGRDIAVERAVSVEAGKVTVVEVAP
jgi:hypothetical protein